MSPPPRENAALVRGFRTDIAAGEDTVAAAPLLAEDVVDHALVFGSGQVHETTTALGRSVFAGVTVDGTVEDAATTSENMAVRATVAGTHRESLIDLALTGASFEVACASFCRLDGGIAETWSLSDGLGLTQQLGALPEVPPEPLLHRTDRPVVTMTHATANPPDESSGKRSISAAEGFEVTDNGRE